MDPAAIYRELGEPAMAQAPHLTEQQRKWFASVRESLECDTGRTLKQWVAIAKTCPFDKQRARERWLKENYGIGINRASLIFSEAFPGERAMSWDQPEKLLAKLWTDPAQRAIYGAIAARAMKLDGAISGPRNTFSNFSRTYQFAAARPTKTGVRLGLAVEPSASPRLAAPKKEGWSERLKAVTVLTKANEVDAEIGRLLKAAWERS
jgi:hypothetical protein